VAHHGDLGIDDGLDHRDPLAPALELHGPGPGPDQGGGVAHRVLDRDVVAEPRQVADDQRPAGVIVTGLPRRQAAGHGRRVVHQVVDGDLERVGVAEHDHRHGVADEDQIGTAVGDQAGAGRVVGGDHDEGVGTGTHLGGAHGGDRQ
jgi:hypothetical protein